MDYEIIKSKRGKDQILLNGFVFGKERETSLNVIWKCTESRNKLCPARIHTDLLNGHIVKNVSIEEHTHTASAAIVGVKKTINRLKSIADTVSGITAVKPAGVIQQVRATTAQPIQPYLPSVSAMKKAFKRRVKTNNRFDEEPQSIEQIRIPGRLHSF